MAASPSSSSKVNCPSCSNEIAYSLLNDHLDRCLSAGDLPHQAGDKPAEERTSNIPTPSKTQSTSNSSPTIPKLKTENAIRDSTLGLKRLSNSTSQNSNSHKKSRFNPAPSTSTTSIASTSSSSKPDVSTFDNSEVQQSAPITTKSRMEAAAPLAERLRPRSLDEFLGQEEVINGPLKGMLSKGLIPSCILWGPPGTGKTTLARLLTREASTSNPFRFVELSATTATTTDVKKVFDEALNRLQLNGQRTVLFLDEIQRFNRAQQDVFLPALEKGLIIVIGATTENPSFRLQGALLSRMRVFILKKLSVESCLQILKNARTRAVEIGLEKESQEEWSVTDEMLEWIANLADGDARSALSTFELALVTFQDSNSPPEVRLEELKVALKRTSLNYDRSGDMHYDTISALHKSIRGSDANGAMYWLARMITSGDDPLYIARRLIIAASEDVGTPEALQVATSVYTATSVIGYPECAEPLAQAVIYLAEAHKSTRAYRALKKAVKHVREGYNHPVPLHIRNAPTKLMKDIGYGKEYRYEPSFAHPVYQPFLPSEIRSMRFVSPPTDTEEQGLNEALTSNAKPEEEVGTSKGKGRGLGLTTANGTGPGSCQRVFEIADRAVDIALLEEWERERNGGRRWEGRDRLIEAIKRREEEGKGAGQ